MGHFCIAESTAFVKVYHISYTLIFIYFGLLDFGKCYLDIIEVF